MTKINLLKSVTAAVRKKLKTFNAAMCPNCLDIVVSHHVHDFRSCTCYKESKDKIFEYIGPKFYKNGSYTKAYKKIIDASTGIFVDGGYDYMRVGFASSTPAIRLQLSIATPLRAENEKK